MVLGNQRGREKFGRFIKKFCRIRESLFEQGVKIFAMVGFIYGMNALAIVSEGRASNLVLWSARAFGFWLGLVLTLALLSLLMIVIYKNKKNWSRRRKR